MQICSYCTKPAAQIACKSPELTLPETRTRSHSSQETALSSLPMTMPYVSECFCRAVIPNVMQWNSQAQKLGRFAAAAKQKTLGIIHRRTFHNWLLKSHPSTSTKLSSWPKCRQTKSRSTTMSLHYMTVSSKPGRYRWTGIFELH